METIKLDKLSIGYRTGKHSTKIIAEGLDASVQSGELTCLIGTNGIGKSTLLRTLASFQPKMSGNVFINGTEIELLSNKTISKAVSVVLTGRPDTRNITAYELAGMGRSPYTGFWGTLSDEDRDIVDLAMETLGISNLKDRMIQTLSDGECQKVMIAKALAQQTPIIILDEPTAFLDFPSKVEIMQQLRTLAHDLDKTVFLSTHDIELALQTADRLWIMTNRNKLEVGTPHDLAEQGILSDFLERDGIIFDKSTLSIRII